MGSTLFSYQKLGTCTFLRWSKGKMGKKWCQLYFLFKKMNLEFYSKEKLKKEVLAIVGM